MNPKKRVLRVRIGARFTVRGQDNEHHHDIPKTRNFSLSNSLTTISLIVD